MYVAFWPRNIWEESPYDCEGKKNLLGNHFLLRTPTFAGELLKPADLFQHAEEEDGDGGVLQLEVLPHLLGDRGVGVHPDPEPNVNVQVWEQVAS